MPSEAQETVSKPEAPLTLRAVDVLRERMKFNHNVAQDIIAGIIVLLKKDVPPRGDLLAQMYKEYSRTADLAVDCAAKLAPYESPKLQSMEVKTENIHRFVVRTPAPAATTEEWMKTSGATHAPQRQIEPIHRVAQLEEIEDVEIVEDVEIPELQQEANDYNSPTEF